MELTINETPKRTSKNFKINNIQIDENTIPKKISQFSNLNIKLENSNITNNIKNTKLKYGLGKEIENQVIENSNQKIFINIENSNNEESTLEFTLDEKNSNLVDNIQIQAQQNTKCTIIIKYLSKAKKAYHNGQITLTAKQNSNVNIVILNLLNEEDTNLLAIENNIEENANANYVIIDLGAKQSIINYYSNIKEKNAQNTVKGIYIGKKNQILDQNYIAELWGENNNINIDIQGALQDNSKKHFKGTIDFKKGSKKSVGSENENCILLSERAKSISLPMLLCSEEDVEGAHSSSCGKIEEKELFYVMSRGFSQKEAMKLMVRAKFNNIIKSVDNKQLQEEILNEIDKRLD